MSVAVAAPDIELSAAQARRAAIAAQGLARARPKGRVDVRHLRRALDALGIVQLDSVNVFSRSHYMPLFSRLGPYPKETLDELTVHQDGQAGRASAERRELFEYWGHEASLIPVDMHPLMRWRMARADDLAWAGVARVAKDDPKLVKRVLELVRDQGPIRAADVGSPKRVRQAGEMWNWNAGKKALEYLFFAGQVTAERRVNFERLYDLPERVLPAAVLEMPTPPADEAQRELLLFSARRLGVATEPDLGDYFRLPRADSKARLAELVEAGSLKTVAVKGWSAPGYAPADLAVPRRIRARALLTPFDPMVWARERTERLFDFRYRIEIYVPAPKRVHGYYVLPFLLGDRLVARVDLKSDRQAGVLRVVGAFAEPKVDADVVARELADELRLVSEWLGLGGVEVARKGDLAGTLRKAVADAAE
ncbi:MAG TPA: crosslink repair DNA glycosylase YcaQ family protein [Solirubrobacterales bacterium]|nr:crosslink repair DNA glycosylase YcaQ family protein [Solirubrobacterales bacterium]